MESICKTDLFGTKEWYNSKGQLHREDGPAAEAINGSRLWYINGCTHREDGPAIEWCGGEKRWYINGKLHRIDGPAIEMSHGDNSWYLNGTKIYCNSNEEFLRIVKMKTFL
jgi:hypothetical protein